MASAADRTAPAILHRLLEREGAGTPFLGAYVLPERAPQYAEPNVPMHPKLREALLRNGIERLFTHQAKAFDQVMRGQDAMLVTGTNSGKTLGYMLPAYEQLLAEPLGRVLALYPTKALAQDQLRRFEALRPWPDLRCGVYDGDTPANQRAPIRRLAQIVLTNPDMLHVGILPGHQNWAKFLKSLRLIVLDEAHVYRGVFGSHVAAIVRRLLRLCAWYGSRPRIVACTATIGNPTDLFGQLTGRAVEPIENDGSGQPRKTFALWNPAIQAEAGPSPNWLSARLMVGLAVEGKRSLVFCRSRVSAELVLRYARELAGKDGGARPDQFDSYRSGYTPQERRKLEKAIHKGDLLALACTNALELGVDIGQLDAVVLNGYPGSAAAFRQQAGRAGRGDREGLAVFVAHSDPLEQFFVREPESLILGAAERVALNPGNPNILEPQLRCAAYERALDPSELETFASTGLETAESMDRAGTLAFRAGRFFYPFHEAPAPQVDIRGSGGDSVLLAVGDEELGLMERWRALQNAHQGAVYLHRGAAYVVERLDLEQGTARLAPFEGAYYTQPIVQSLIEPLFTIAENRLGELCLTLGSIRVTDMVLGYRKRALEGDLVLETVDLDLPPTSFETVGLRFDLSVPVPSEPSEAEEEEESVWAKLAPQVHALEHALLAVAPLLAGCDRNDLGSAWFVAFPPTFAPAVYLFDRFAGGMGLAEKLFDSADGLLDTAGKALSGCACLNGCPKCLYSSRCEISNDALSKPGALGLLG
jgi:DEAD/DEAH box helicase domain-containing protein